MPLKSSGMGKQARNSLGLLLTKNLKESNGCDHAYAIIPKATQIQYMKLKDNAELMSIDYLIGTVLKLRSPKKTQ